MRGIETLNPIATTTSTMLARRAMLAGQMECKIYADSAVDNLFRLNSLLIQCSFFLLAKTAKSHCTVCLCSCAHIALLFGPQEETPAGA